MAFLLVHVMRTSEARWLIPPAHRAPRCSGLKATPYPSRSSRSVSDIGASKEYAVGAGGSTTNAGGTTRLGAAGSEILQATGGQAGAQTGNTTTVGVSAAGGPGGVGTLGDFNFQGQPGGRGIIHSTTHGSGGVGGAAASFLGSAAVAAPPPGVKRRAATAARTAGAGAHTANDTNRNGGTGADGVLLFVKFV
jgi:hypothetical protein